MKISFLFIVLAFFVFIKSAHAVQSTVTEAEGYSCMGDEKSRKRTEQDAMIDAKKNAAEYTSTYVKSETQVQNFAVQKDIVTAYSNAEVTIIEDLDKGWYKDPSAGDCYKIKIKAEVTPDQEAMKRIALATAGTGTEGTLSFPVAPPPLPGTESPTAQGSQATPDVVVVPSEQTYVYMVPNTTGIYFYDGFWFRYYEGYWFCAPRYGSSWGMVAAVAVPRAVANVPPEYPRYLPPTYNRIPAHDLQQHWQEWDRTKEWNNHDWFRNELKPDVVQQRQALIQHERDEHQKRRERISQAQEQHRLEMEHKGQIARQQQAQHADKLDHPKSKKEKQERQQKERKQKKKKKPKKAKQIKKEQKRG